MNSRIRVELSVMMFLQFFIWGAWFVSLSTYCDVLGFSPEAKGAAYRNTYLATIVAPFIGMVADRFFQAQVVLGICHLVGGCVMLYATTITSPVALSFVLLAYALCYMPTLALVNAISFNQMSSPQAQFPSVRVVGTIGWIAAGWVVSLLKWEPTAHPLMMAAVVSFAMGVYSFLLPATPPKAKGKKMSVREALGLDALKLLRDPNFAIFVLASLLICFPLAFYYAFANGFLTEKHVPLPTLQQSFGQVSEVGFMILMPLFFRRLGIKKMLLIGMAAWAIRYVLFAFGQPSFPLVLMYWMAILLHGICYDFFFVTGQIYVDRVAPKEIQASAQGFITLVTFCGGLVFGTMIAGKVVSHYTVDKVANWMSIWLTPAAMAVIVLVGFFLLFREPKEQAAAD